MGVEDKLKELGIELPAAAAPVASYVPAVEADNMLYVSGQISFAADGSLIKGRLGDDLSVAQGQAAAERCALMILAQAKAALGGSFGRLERGLRGDRTGLRGLRGSVGGCGAQSREVGRTVGVVAHAGIL